MVKDISYYKDLYITTAIDYLERTKTDVSRLLKNPHNREAIEEIYINVHSLKSQSAAMGYSETAMLPAAMEELFFTIKKGGREINEDILIKMMSSLEDLSRAIENIKTEDTELDLSDSIERIKKSDQLSAHMKILIIEDDTFFQKFYSTKLLEQGFEVVIASNGQQGLEKLQTFTPDIILLDIIMPVMDGFEVLEELSKNEVFRRIPVLVFSTLGQESDIEKAMRLGATGYVNKSFFDLDNLLQKIQAVIQAKAQS
jgi:CheY-like chemotaxis protein